MQGQTIRCMGWGFAAMICGCTLDPAAIARFGAPVPTATPAEAPAAGDGPAPDTPTSTLLTRKDVKISMFKVSDSSGLAIYETSNFDLFKGFDTDSGDVGHLQFSFVAGLYAKTLTDAFGVDAPLILWGRRFTTNRIQVNYVDSKSSDFDGQKMAPEFGWSAVAPGERGRIGVKVGNIYFAKIRLNDDQDQLYGKIQVKDFNDLKVTFDYAIQTATGSRQLQ